MDKYKVKRFLATAITVFLLICCLPFALHAKADTTSPLRIAAGGKKALFFQASTALCQLVTETLGRPCEAMVTGGALDNLRLLKEGKADFAISQTHLEYAAFKGIDNFKDQGVNLKLRTVLGLFPEYLTVAVRADSGIFQLSDLKGRRINISNIGSGSRLFADKLLQKLGWKEENFALVGEAKTSSFAKILCGDKVDAIIYLIGHPNPTFQEMAETCPIRFIPVTGKILEALAAESPTFVKTVIPAGVYPNMLERTETLGVNTVLSASETLDNDTAYAIVKLFYSKQDELKAIRPVFAGLKAETLMQSSEHAPLHPGALKYYQEQGNSK